MGDSFRKHLIFTGEAWPVQKAELTTPGSLVHLRRARSQSRRKHHYSSPDVFKSSLIYIGIGAVGIFNVPVFDLGPFGAWKRALLGVAAHVNHHVGRGPFIRKNGLGVKPIRRVAVILQGLQSELLHHAERRQSGAARIEKIRGVANGNRFGHWAAAGISDTKKKHAKLFFVSEIPAAAQ